MIYRLLEQLKSDNIYLRVKVRPNARQNEIKEEMTDGTLKIDVAAVPERGKANQELIKFLARELRIKKENIRIISGAADHLKLLKIVK